MMMLVKAALIVVFVIPLAVLCLFAVLEADRMQLEEENAKRRAEIDEAQTTRKYRRAQYTQAMKERNA